MTRGNPYYAGQSMYGPTGLEQYGISEVQAQAPGVMSTMGHKVLPMAASIGALGMGMDPLTLGYKAFKGVATPGVGGGLGGAKAMGGKLLAGKVGLGKLGLAVGAAALPIAGAMGVAKAGSYAVDQMVQGAGVHAGIESALSSKNFGLRGGQMGGLNMDEVSQTFKEVYNMAQDLDRGVQEITSSITSMRQLNLTQTMQSAREFRKTFKEATQALDSIAKEYGITMEEAGAYFKGAKGAGFSSLQDQKSSLTMTRRAEWMTGLNRAQVQGVMTSGTQLARSIGATGWRGAAGMAESLAVTGAALQGGVLSEKILEEVTGQTGSEAIASFSQIGQHSMARILRSQRGRYFLAAAASDDMRGLDPEKMGELFSGAYTMGDIKKMGRKAAYGKGRKGMADRFLMYEEEMRGQMLQMGPTALAGMIRAEMGDRLYDTEDYTVNRDVRKKFGLNKRQADAMMRMSRDVEGVIGEQYRQEEMRLDLQSSGYANRGELAQFKSKISKWWDQNVNHPLQQAGAAVSNKFREWGDRLGAAAMGVSYSKPGRIVQQTAGSREYIAGLASGRYTPSGGGPTARLTGGNSWAAARSGFAQEIFTGEFGADITTTLAGQNFEMAGFSSLGMMESASAGLGKAVGAWAVSDDAARLQVRARQENWGARKLMLERHRSMAAHDPSIDRFLGQGSESERMQRAKHLTGRHLRGTAHDASGGVVGRRKPVYEYTREQFDKISRDLTGDLDVAMYGSDGVSLRDASGFLQDGLSKLFSGEGVGFWENTKDFLSGLPGVSSVMLAADHFFGDEYEKLTTTKKSEGMRNLLEGEFGGAILRAASGDKTAIDMVRRKAISGGVPKDQLEHLENISAGLGTEEGRAAILKAAPVVHGKQMQDYVERVSARMTRMGTRMTAGERGVLRSAFGDESLLGGLTPGATLGEQIRGRGEFIEEYMGKYMDLDEEEQRKVHGVFQKHGLEGSEFAMPMQTIMGIRKQWGKKTKMGRKGGTRMINRILGTDMREDEWKNIRRTAEGKLTEGDEGYMGLQQIQERFSLDEETSHEVMNVLRDGSLSKEESKKLLLKTIQQRAQASYTGRQKKDMDTLSEFMDMDTKSFGTDKGLHAELGKHTVLLAQLVSETKNGNKVLGKLGIKPGGQSKDGVTDGIGAGVAGGVGL